MNNNSLKIRVAVFLSIISSWFLIRFFLMTKIRIISFHLFANNEAITKILFNHLLIVLEAFFMYLLYTFYKRHGWIAPIKIKTKKFLFLGIFGGIGIFFSAFPIVFHYGMKIYPQFSWGDIIGNIFSNAGEEFIYRGLIYAGTLSLFRSTTTAIIVSGIAFGIGHWDMPYLFQAYAAVVGIVLGIICTNTKTLAVPYVSHMVADLLSDALFH